MCDPSKIAEDWVIKGCHIHVDGVELSVCPDHRGGVAFKAVFSSTAEKLVRDAIKTALEKCLPNPDVRQRWIRDVKRARLLMISTSGELRTLANGRLLEFKYLILAIERYVVTNG